MDIIPRLDGMLHLFYILCFPDSSSTSAKFRKDLANQHCLNIGGMFKKIWKKSMVFMGRSERSFKHRIQNRHRISEISTNISESTVAILNFLFMDHWRFGGGFKDFWGFHPETKMIQFDDWAYFPNGLRLNHQLSEVRTPCGHYFHEQCVFTK